LIINQQAASESTALIKAASGDHAEMVKSLLLQGADPKIQASYGRTALHEAASNNNAEIGRILLEHGADPTVEFNGRLIPEEFIRSLRQPGTDTQR